MTKNVISAMTARISVTTKMIRVGAFSVNMFAPIKKSRCQNKSQRQPVTVKAAAPHSGSRLEGDHNGEKSPPVFRLKACGVCVYEGDPSQFDNDWPRCRHSADCAGAWPARTKSL
jgi:hypothetical protein